MDIRTVTVELLRAGPRHNQLVSPLTQYLGVCGNAAAATITLPYEHADLEQRLQELRYTVTASEDPTRPTKMLDRTGREMAAILAAIPGVSGLLNPEDARPETLTHLRIVLSASELAMLPFEASKTPSGAGSGSVWLALQARAPVCITRHIRSVSAGGIRWPSEPRILFVAGPNTPFEEHRTALENVMAPWRDEHGSFGDRLVVLDRPKLADVSGAIRSAAARNCPFTHVHILAHGARIEDDNRYSSVGIVLNDDGGVASGSHLATSLISVVERGVGRPVVVTLASCDSAMLSDVRTTDASVAHELHDQGIPLVVASQFPLTEEGSVPLVERFYDGQVWGEHPFVSLYDVRLQLHSRMGPDIHDWASVVVYEALPSDLSDQLEDLRYWQARRAHEGVLKRVEKLAAQPGPGAPLTNATELQDRYEAAAADVTAMAKRLPKVGPYALECAGLRASGLKRLAQTAFELAVAQLTDDDRKTLFADSLRCLEEARTEYWRATKALLGSWGNPGRKKSNLHWLLGQVLSLDVVLGRPLDVALLTTARVAAEIDLESPSEEDRAWAHVSLSELALLRLADPNLAPDRRPRCAEDACANAVRFLELLGRGSEHASTTSRQFERYSKWWGSPDFGRALEELGVDDRPHWQGEHGIVETAKKVVALLPRPQPDRPRAVGAESAATGDRPSSPAAPSTSSAPARTLARSVGSFAIEMLPAENGDCVWIEYGDPAKPRRVLIDCGSKSAAGAVAARINSIEPPGARRFELFALTHIDADHINGVLPLFDALGRGAEFGDIWFNGWHQVSQFLSVEQGEAFSKLLEDRALPWNRAVTAAGARHPAALVAPADQPPPTFELEGGLLVTLLSPGAQQLKRLGRDWKAVLLELEPGKAMLSRKRPPAPVTDFSAFDLKSLARTPAKKDTSVPNGSSLALLLEFDGRAVLVTGDAHADVLAKSIRALQRARGHDTGKLKLDALKLSHHGSANATTVELLSLLDCPRYLVSSNGNIHYHPDREAIARVVLHGGPQPTLFFNYRTALNALWDEQVLRERYDYRAVYPSAGMEGLRITL